MKTIILGVDPGLQGAIAVYDTESKNLLEVFDMPTEHRRLESSKKFTDGVLLHARLEPYADRIRGAVIEEIWARPGKGAASMLNFGYSAGVVAGVLQGMGVRIHLTPPSVWKMLMGVTASKAVSRLRAAALFPEQRKLFDRAKDDGRAEAALLAHFGQGIFRRDA